MMTAMTTTASRKELERQLAELRPRLHRYCARMTGSVFDGEDVVQDALGKALQALDAGAEVDRIEPWLVRIAHNAAIDFLRRRARQETGMPDDAAETLADPAPDPEAQAVAHAGLGSFLALSATQRSCVILMDVLGYS